MKSNFIYKLLFFCMLFFIQVNIVAAKEKILTCKYNVNMFSGWDTKIPLEVDVYDDKSVVFQNKDPKGKGKIINFTNKGQGTNFYVDTSNGNVWSHGTYIKLQEDPKKFYNYAIKNDTYSCPALYVWKINYDMQYGLEWGNDDDFTGGTSTETAVTTSVIPIVHKKEEEDKVITETHTCRPIFKDEGFEFSLTLKMYSDGSKKACINPDDDGETCSSVTQEDVHISYTNVAYRYNFTIEKAQIPYFFTQTDEQKTNNTFTCPSTVYHAWVGDGYILTTSAEDAEDIAGDRYDELEDGTGTNPDEDNRVDVDKCNTIPVILIEYMKEALKLIRWIGLAAMIILGVLDFVKASAADDQDALKKAWGHFTKRLIAVIILFILPMLIEVILYLANLNTCDISF